jgi:hypothetical protein
LGQINRDVPYSLFNHAIVYVPAQKDLAEGRFFDATSDALDVDVIRHDDPGTTALVFDFKQMKTRWIPIPFQAPDMNRWDETITVDIAKDGTVKGTMAFKTKGKWAIEYRASFRNPEDFKKNLQLLADNIIKGSTVKSEKYPDISSIEKPVELQITVSSDTFARVSDKTLKFKIPFDDSTPKNYFALEQRDYPLVLGVPVLNRWSMSFKLPAKSKIKSVPEPFIIDTKCIKFSRVVTVKPGPEPLVNVEQSLSYLCEQIPAGEYPLYRKNIQKLISALEEDVVVKLK